jgi:ribosomal protein S18 acetylase RimI-like enzyme
MVSLGSVPAWPPWVPGFRKFGSGISRRLCTHLPNFFKLGTCVAGYDGHRGWVNYLAVEPDLQGSGLGRAMMAEVEGRLRVLGCPEANLQIRRGNLGVVAFYRRLGYAEDDLISMGKRLERDDGA